MLADIPNTIMNNKTINKYDLKVFIICSFFFPSLSSDLTTPSAILVNINIPKPEKEKRRPDIKPFFQENISSNLPMIC